MDTTTIPVPEHFAEYAFPVLLKRFQATEQIAQVDLAADLKQRLQQTMSSWRALESSMKKAELRWQSIRDYKCCFFGGPRTLRSLTDKVDSVCMDALRGSVINKDTLEALRVGVEHMQAHLQISQKLNDWFTQKGEIVTLEINRDSASKYGLELRAAQPNKAQGLPKQPQNKLQITNRGSGKLIANGRLLYRDDTAHRLQLVELEVNHWLDSSHSTQVDLEETKGRLVCATFYCLPAPSG